MRILKRYITQEFLTTFLITLVTVTFVMCLVIMFKATAKIAEGHSWAGIAIIALSAVPTVLTFSIPMSCMVASLLVFERLSGEGEITAMRACGVSIWHIVRPPLLIATLMAAFCLLLNAEVAAKAHHLRRETALKLAMKAPIKLLSTGHFVRDFPGMTIRVGEKNGDLLRDIIIYENKAGQGVREIRALEGRVRMSEDKLLMTLELYEGVRVDPLQPGRPGEGYMSSLSLPIDLSALPKKEYTRKMVDYTADQLVEMVGQADEANRMRILVEINQRIVLSLSCIGFAILGIPLGIKTPRSTSSMGIALSLLIVFFFYLFIILVNSLTSHPQFRPDLIVWIPIVFALGMGTHLLRKMR